MKRSWSLGVVVVLAVTAAWLLGGCGGSESGAPEGAGVDTQAAAPIAVDAAGLAKVIIGFKQQPGQNERALVQGLGGKVKYVYQIIPGIAATIPEQAVEALRRNPNVQYVEGDIQVQALEDQLVWGADRIDAEKVWGGQEDAVDIASGALTGSGVKVAIIDTGIDYTHPDLNDNYVGGYDFANGDDDPLDDHGHGTHCAGIVAAEDNEGGVIQVAPEASLYALKVLTPAGLGSAGDVIAALQWCVANGIQVASMSFGSGGGTSLKEACDAAYAAEVLLVAAAGNGGAGKDTVAYPAHYGSVIAVAATKENDHRAKFSSTGPVVELAAPGVDIYSTGRGGGYRYKSGTSMACPHVAGVAALVIESGVTEAVAVRGRLNNTAEDLGSPGRDTKYGYGLVDAEAAVGGNQRPVAGAGSDQSGSPGDELTFDGSGSYDPDGTIVSWDWSFGDDSIGSGEVVSHAYASEGTYTVTLTVTDDEGATDTDTCLATVTTGAATASVSGTIHYSEGGTVAGAQVTLLRNGNKAQKTRSDANGQYVFTEVLAGDGYQVNARKKNRTGSSSTFTLVPGEEKTVNLAI